MTEIKLTDAEPSVNPHNVHMSRLLANEKVQLAHVVLKKGDSITPHASPSPAVFYVIQGEGVVTIGNEEKKIGQDTLVECPPNIDHGWANNIENDLRILVIKLPA